MNKRTKIFVIACGYATLAFLLTKLFELNLFSEFGAWGQAFAMAGVAFVCGIVENALGFGFFDKWLDA